MERNVTTEKMGKVDGFELTDFHSFYSSTKYSNLYSSASSMVDANSERNVEKNVGERRENVAKPDRLMALRENDEGRAKWVSPVDANKRRWVRAKSRPGLASDENPFGKCPDSSFDLNSSMISLDFGLISPRRNWSSPPQRIERAQNREWSPHRVIDRPNPENSPGNWISVKESCQEPLPLTAEIGNAFSEPFVYRPAQEVQRSSSQNTYVVPEKIAVTATSRMESQQPTRKTSVLMDYVPDRGGGGDGVQAKKRAASLAEPGSFPPTSDKVRRVVDSGGRVIKTSLLGDYRGSGLGKGLESKTAEEPDKTHLPGDPPTKIIKKSLNLKPGKKLESFATVKTSKLSTDAPTKKETVSKDVPKSREREIEDKENKEMKLESEDATTEEPGMTIEKNKDVSNDTKKIIMDLENILRDKPAGSSEKGGERREIKSSKGTFSTEKTTTEVEPPALREKKKRNIDTKGVQEFMRSQKQKRVEMLKANKKTKVEERETIKKNLEELRVKTLKLAAAKSKKKKPPINTIKTVDPGTEDDVTMSLGLKQIKPKVSYNELVSNLKKKTPRANVQQTVPEPVTNIQKEEDEKLEDGEEKVSEREKEEEKREEENVETRMIEPLVKPSTNSAARLNIEKSNGLKETLKKLAETLHMKIAEEKSQTRPKPPDFKSAESKALKDISSKVIRSKDLAKSIEPVFNENPQRITIDLNTIYSLKEDIKKISENFKVLHQIIVEKADLNEKKNERKVDENTQTMETKMEKPSASYFGLFGEKAEEEIPKWLRKSLPKPHPYSVYTAFRRKMNLETTESSMLSVTSQETSSYADTVSNKPESHFEALSVPSDRLQSSVNRKSKIDAKSSKTTAEENYFSLDNSGSEFSSSILDSDKQIFSSLGKSTKNPTSSSVYSSASGEYRQKTRTNSTTTPSIATEITPKMTKSTSLISEISRVNFHENKENLILTAPDVKLISNDLSDSKLKDSEKDLECPLESPSPKVQAKNEELNNAGDKSRRDSRSDSTITEIIDNLSENGKCQVVVKTTNKKFQDAVQRIENNQQIRRSFFQPEMLHLQFQAELTLLETFQQSLSHFLEAERHKTLSEVTKIVYEKSVNTEKSLEKEDQAVQTTFVKEDSVKSEKITAEEAETESVLTDMEISEEESVKSVKTVSSIREVNAENEEKMSRDDELSRGKEGSDAKTIKSEMENEKGGDSPDLSNGHAGISFQMLERVVKDEELRSEHQLALIRLREKTLNEKVKAELTFLEMKKRALKEGGNDEDQNVSAIKKRQRGILMKYQSEKEEIERLKKMHKIASEERKIMIEQQKQIQKMQLSTKDMLSKLRRREKSEKSSSHRRNLLKPLGTASYKSQSEVEDLGVQMSDSILTESVGSIEGSSENSLESELEISSEYNGSDAESDVIRKRNKTVESGISGLEGSAKSAKKSSALEPGKYPRKRHSVDELMNWTRRLEEKENRLRELERKTIGTGIGAKNRTSKPLKNVKTFMKDRSTSPFQFPESLVSPTENSSSISEVIEAKNSPIISETVPESIYRTEITEKTDKMPETVSEDVPIHFSKNGSRTFEYYSESFESPSSSNTHKIKALGLRSKTPMRSEGSSKSIPIKLSLSPRIQSPRRRNSSGSDDSQNFSHTETASEQSDLETRIAVLHEQLRKRKLEAERLRREQKKAQRERLKVKEQSLLKQIQAYDAYIQKKKQELEQEYENSSQAISKPLIKQPKVAEKNSIKLQESLLLNETDKIKLYPRVVIKSPVEKDEVSTSKKPTESDSEIQELIKEGSEKTSTSGRQSSSLTEQIESKTEEVEEEEEDEIEEQLSKKKSIDISESKEVSSGLEGENSSIEASETAKGSTVSPRSVPEPEIEIEGSLSESEDQSASIKTTVQSPEKQDTEILEFKDKTDVAEDGSKLNVVSSFENTYLSDSFESDFEEKSVPKTGKKSEESEVVTDISVTKSFSTRVKEEEVEGETEKEGKSESRKSVSEVEKEEPEIIKEINSASECSEIKSVLSEEGTIESTEKMAKAELISNSIIVDILTESLKTFSNRETKIQRKLKEEFRANREILASVLAKGIIAETIEDMLKIYGRKLDSVDEKETEVDIQDKQGDEEPISPEKITSDIRKRICEIISQTTGIKDQRRPQDMMVTTYDVTPGETSPSEEGCKTNIDEREEFIRSLTSTPRENKSPEIYLPVDSIQQENKNKFLSQEWFDNDYGLSRTRREAEQLRLQQIQIEQEIQQLKAQQEQIPYYYLREIPNKPPPPYTPPGKPFSEIPASEEDVLTVTSDAVDILTREMKNGKSPSEVEPPKDFFGTGVSDHVRHYKTFLFHLARHLIDQVVTIQDKRKEKVLPWNKVREPLSVYKYTQIERNEKGLSDYVRKQVLVLFGFRRKIGRESLMMRCFKKKRDHVDEILVCESQEEESQWTTFDEDEVAVKNEVALGILDGLLLESAQLFNGIFKNKAKRLK